MSAVTHVPYPKPFCTTPTFEEFAPIVSIHCRRHVRMPALPRRCLHEGEKPRYTIIISSGLGFLSFLLYVYALALELRTALDCGHVGQIRTDMFVYLVNIRIRVRRVLHSLAAGRYT